MRLVIIVLTLVVSLGAAEYRGQVTFGGLPLPGVSIIATQGNRTLATSTDERGQYSFADLPAGKWSLQIQKLGFAPMTQEINSGADLPGASIELKVLPLDQIEAPAEAKSTGRQPQPSTEPAPEITSELTQRAEDGVLVNGSSVNG